jgi:hypothetical protein
MIMNKRIFTLLIGVVLAFSSAFTATAESWNKDNLGIGKPIEKLVTGHNGFYHLKVDSIATWDKTSSTPKGYGIHAAGANRLSDSVVLFLGRSNAPENSPNPDYDFFIHPLVPTGSTGDIHGVTNVYGYTGNAASDDRIAFGGQGKAEVSAASLWCTFVNSTTSPTFTFANKLQADGEVPIRLELDVNEYDRWKNRTVNDRVGLLYTEAKIGYGGVSNWTFSPIYQTSLKTAQPLYASLDEGTDSVAVLCLNLEGSSRPATLDFTKWTSKTSLVVKIAHVSDVKDGRVDGMLYFTLVEAASFVLTDVDFNSSLGNRTLGTGSNDLKVEINGTNVSATYLSKLIDAGLRAEAFAVKGATTPSDSGYYINPAKRQGITARTRADLYTQTRSFTSTDTIRYSNLDLDTLGYIQLSNEYPAQTGITGKAYLRVTENAYTSNAGEKYLKLLYGNPRVPDLTAIESLTTHKDSIELLNKRFDYGHYAFRMVYHPSDNNIKINAFQATHAPNAELAAAFKSDDGEALDSLKRIRLTFVADTSNLEFETHLKVGGSTITDSIHGWGELSDAWSKSTAYLTAPLISGKFTANYYSEYNYHQRLYITSQQLTSGQQVETLNDKLSSNTKYYFKRYNDCTGGEDNEDGRRSVEPGVYLIRNAQGAYLNVPLYSSNDSAIWTTPKAGIDPAYLPSYQWIIEKVYYGDSREGLSPLKITNREFPWMYLEHVQLRDKYHYFPISPSFPWNDSRYFEGANYEIWEVDEWSTGKQDYTKTFIALKDKSLLSDENLGYLYIPSSKLPVSSYQIEYVNSLSTAGSFLGTRSESDPYLYANISQFNSVFFKLDTIPAGSVPTLGNYQTHGYRLSSGETKLKTDDYGRLYNPQFPNLVELKRQPYNLLSLGLSQTCASSSNSDYLTLDDENRYYIHPSGATKSEAEKALAPNYKPAYFLRNLQGTGEDAYFALVQVVDTVGSGDATKLLLPYLVNKYGKERAQKIISVTTPKEGYYNPGILVASVNSLTGGLEAQLRAEIGQTNPAAFALKGSTGNVYRRFEEPIRVSFFSTLSGTSGSYLYENVGKKNYLGWTNVTTDEGKNTATELYIDTAYVNRPDGDKKPQYLIAKDAQVKEKSVVCDPYGYPTDTVSAYTIGRYLINADDSAYKVAGKPDQDFLWGNQWTRLVFVDAVHTADYIYYLNAKAKTELQWTGGTDAIPSAELSDALKASGLYKKNSDGDYHLDVDSLVNHKDYGAAVNIGKDNTHKTSVFSFRIVERGATEGNEDFIIESLGSNDKNLDKIAPCTGAWVRILNGIPVLSERDGKVQDLMNSSSVFNVTKQRNGLSNLPVEVPAVQVVSEVGGITILGSAGKRVVLTNVLGQPIVSKVLTSDRESISLPKGIVLVSVDGSSVAKAVVK